MINKRIAAAPISWGICEVPNWGYQLDTDEVLTQIKELGIDAIEFGPDDFLGTNIEEIKLKTLKYGIRIIAGFVPILLHDNSHDPLNDLPELLNKFLECEVEHVTFALSTGNTGYDNKAEISEHDWRLLFDNLAKVAGYVESLGLDMSVHPHMGTMIENSDDLNKFLDNSSVNLCLDTGHLTIGGVDPVYLVENYAHRISHVHLKDVNHDFARLVQRNVLSYTDAIRKGIYTPLGDGEAKISQVVSILEKNDYMGWYVMEQDVILESHADSVGALADVRRSFKYLSSLR